VLVDITEILLKVALKTIILTPNPMFRMLEHVIIAFIRDRHYTFMTLVVGRYEGLFT